MHERAGSFDPNVVRQVAELGEVVMLARIKHDEDDLALEAAAECASAVGRRPLHDYEARTLQMIDEALHDDRRH